MRPKEIQKLIELVQNSNINELEVSRWGRKVCIRKQMENNRGEVNSQESFVVAQAPTPSVQVSVPPSPFPIEEPVETKTVEPTNNFMEIRSPMVGTFYRSSSPDAAPYIEVGEQVAKGKVLCIIEAMKLMNEIEAEFPCKIVEVLVENAQPVEYDQVLFKVEKA